MPACATPKTIADQATIRNLFLPVPDTGFRDYLAEVDDLARFAPEIITAIEADLDLHAREMKSLRLADRKFHESKTRDIPCLGVKDREIRIEDLSLADGRPRIPAKAVHMFLMLRGFLGSISAQQAVCFLHESISMYAWLQERGLEMPGVSTVLDNINAVSHTTRELICNRQIARIIGADLDDFQKQTISAPQK